MELIIITGMSGAGKSSAADYLEDMGYYCIDNLPPQLLEALVRSVEEVKDETDEHSIEEIRLALVMDSRSIPRFGRLAPALEELRKRQSSARIVFLEASDKVILSRYKQSRRNHPLGGSRMLIEAIQEEREGLVPVRELATDIIDTSQTSPSELRDILYRLFREPDKAKRMKVFIQSFGFKYGLPMDCDLVWDVRFLPNPYYLPELRPFSGLDAEVSDYVLAFDESRKFVELQLEFLRFALPLYQKEGKMRMNIAVGCTGGRHRSVALAEVLKEQLEPIGYPVFIDHRDIKRDPVAGV